MSLKIIQRCGICQSDQLGLLWDLPRLPLTERFGPYHPEKCPGIDQKLLFCEACSHVQLGYQIEPETLYSSHYAFRTSMSATAVSGTAFFTEFLAKTTSQKKFRSLLDVGGNDLYLAKQLVAKAQNRCVIDPICTEMDGKEVDGIKVYGRLIESVNLSQNLVPPDLVVSRHTLEHISEPRRVLAQLFEECTADAVYFFEIPCFDNLVESLRFDAIFHQHYHYYTLTSFQRLLWETGGEYIAHAYNHQGSCGGALVVMFRKSASRGPKPSVDTKVLKEKIQTGLNAFRLQMEAMSAVLKTLPEKTYGYGASLMLATLCYHLKNDLSRLECILDDDASKDGLTYENLPVTVRHTGKCQPEVNANYLITSLENIRPIFRRVQDFKPRRILTPLIS